MKLSQQIRNNLVVSFEHIAENCKTVGDIQKLEQQLRKINMEMF